MTPRKELQLAYATAGITLLIGILCFAAYSAESPKEPLRIMYRTVAGKVMFDHKTHFSEDSYSIACQDCHHHPSDGEDYRTCASCHQGTEGESLPESCLECHDTDDIEGTEMSKASDAAHSQCIDCHKDQDAGPVDCQECHVL